MKPLEPIDTIELFLPLSENLQTILRNLQPADWARPTVCSPWNVKDVAAHLLGSNLGRLWQRGETSPTPLAAQEYDALVVLINRNNELWVQAAQRISPEILIEFLNLTDRRLYEHFSRLKPDQPAPITVAWAGESSSPNWFDIAREYTEKWLHQQHIREAIGQPLLLERKWLFPVLDTFLRGLPHTYRGVEAREGTSISVHITGEAGGEWTLHRDNQAWRLFSGSDLEADCSVQISQDLAWRLFTKGVRSEEAQGRIRIAGDETLGSQILNATFIMA